MNSALELQELYLDYMEDTECPTMYHRWSFLAGIGAMLERNIWLPFGHEKIYTNQYVVLLGPPAARKSTAINALGKLLQEAGYNKFAGDKSSKEKFIEDMSRGFDIEKEYEDQDAFDMLELLDQDIDKNLEISPVFIKASELQDFLGQNNHDFISWLTHIWDNPEIYHHRTKTGKSDKINKPTISLLGGATSSTFQNIFPENILEQGMLSRMLLVYGEGRRKKIAFPKPPSNELRDKLVSKLVQIRNGISGTITLSKEAETILTAIYENWEDLPDTRFATYTGRRFTHLLKLSMVHAAMRLDTKISKDDVILANTILSYTENFMPQALGEFGKSEKGKAVNTILSKIKKAGAKGITQATLFKELIDLNIDPHAFQAYLEQLRTLGRIDHVKKEDELGNLVTFLMATKKDEVLMKKFTDFSLLRESKSVKINSEIPDSELGDFQVSGI